MQIDSNEVEFLVGDMNVLDHMPAMPVRRMFDDRTVQFLAALSGTLLGVPSIRDYVDVMSYAYWIRKASIEAVKRKHRDYGSRLGRGVAFHIAPSNVPVNFAVSMTSSLLAGNCTVVRVSNKPYEQVAMICDAINRLLEKDFRDMRDYLCLIRYEHSERITQELSSHCDVRIIWGGNRTIETIRRASLPPRAMEMTFADRYSVAVIDSDKYMESDSEQIAKGFYTDTYYTDQNACSSPRMVVWLGSTPDKARKIFWAELEKLVRRDYKMKPVQAVDKYTAMCMLGMSRRGARLVSDNNLVMRVQVDSLTADLPDYKSGGGYFFEYIAKELDEIVPLLGKSCQTVSLLGVEKEDVKTLVFKAGVRGVDRIVPLGQTMGLEFIWDGYKMIETMSRFVYTGEYE